MVFNKIWVVDVAGFAWLKIQIISWLFARFNKPSVIVKGKGGWGISPPDRLRFSVGALLSELSFTRNFIIVFIFTIEHITILL
jgi:hypothetical protein